MTQSKKAQLTLFIILGIVILLTVLLFLFLKVGRETKEIAPGMTMVVEELPSEFMPIRPYVENCLEKTTKQGLSYLGERGGYTDTSGFNLGMSETQGDAVRFSSQSSLVVPYWFFLASDNACSGDCSFVKKHLPIKKGLMQDSVEQQLESYVEENLYLCLDDFKSLKDLSFDVKVLDNPVVKVSVLEDSIVSLLELPLEISTRGSKTRINDFYTTLDIHFPRIYNLAIYLTDLEEEYRFLEQNTLNIITAYSGKDKARLPPMSDVGLKISSSLRWQKTQVKNKVATLVASYTSLLQVENSKNYKEYYTGSSYQDAVYNMHFGIPHNRTLSTTNVRFSYLDFWKPYFDLNCKGEICEGESLFTDMIPNIGVQRYAFSYDISYPVLVEIEDQNAFSDQGYTFRFMLETNIRNNRPLEADFVQIAYTTPTSTMLCEPTKRTSADITIDVVDKSTSKPIDGAEMFYTCVESCYLGVVDKSHKKTNFPVCIGGFLSFKKEGYDDLTLPVDATLDDPQYIKAQMSPQKSMKVNLVAKDLVYRNGEFELSAAQKPLTDYEIATINMVSANDYKIIQISADERENLTLSEGEYEVQIMLISDKEYAIPNDQIVSPESGKNSVFNVTSMLTGLTKYNYSFTANELKNNEITFYVLRLDLYSIPQNERTIDQLSVTNELDSYTRQHLIEVLPSFN